VHARRLRLAEETDPQADSRPATERFTKCTRCKGEHGRECVECKGMGWRELEGAALEEDTPQWWPEVGQFLRAWSLVERYGVPGWLALEAEADGTPAVADECFTDALLVFTAELESLEHEQRKAAAEEERREIRRASSKR
jgi:hypothetical protein